MRAAVIQEPGTAPIAAEFPKPVPEEGWQSLTLVAAGIHRVVRAVASGSHYGSDGRYPRIPGVDAVARTEDGRLLYTGFARSPWGTIAEHLATPLGIELPTGADPLAIAAGANPAMSGWMPLVADKKEYGDLGTVVVLGATGMAGRAAVQEAIALGARKVIGLGRNAEALQFLAHHGAQSIPLNAEVPEALAAALAGEERILLLDYIWGAPAETVFTALARSGMGDDSATISYVQIGTLAGAEAAVPGSLLRSRKIRISGSGAGSTSQQQIMAEMPRIMELIAQGTVEIPYTVFPLERITEAWAYDGPERVVIVPTL